MQTYPLSNAQQIWLALVQENANQTGLQPAPAVYTSAQGIALVQALLNNNVAFTQDTIQLLVGGCDTATSAWQTLNKGQGLYNYLGEIFCQL